MIFSLSVFWDFIRSLRHAGLPEVSETRFVDAPGPVSAAVLKARLKVDEANKSMRPEAIEGMRRRLAGDPPAPRECTVDRSGWLEGDSEDRGGLTWEPAEIEFLIDGFSRNFDCAKLAELHRRTEGAIAAQLERQRMLIREGYNDYFTMAGDKLWWSRPRKSA